MIDEVDMHSSESCSPSCLVREKQKNLEPRKLQLLILFLSWINQVHQGRIWMAQNSYYKVLQHHFVVFSGGGGSFSFWS